MVEVDKTKIRDKRKYARGRGGRHLDIWLFTMIDRRRQLFTCMIVPDHSADTLLLLIRRHIAPGTTILSDEWWSYLGVPNIGYHHHTVNHSVTLVSDTGVHTNNIEGVHGLLEAELKIMHRMVPTQIPQYLDELMFRRMFQNEDTLS